MLWTIDPDVFDAAGLDFRCMGTLAKIVETQNQCRFVIDGGAIEEEYLTRFERLIAQNQNEGLDETSGRYLAFKLLQTILGGEADCYEIESSYSPDLENKFQALGCDTPVEPELLAILSRSQQLGVTMLFPGPGITDSKVRHRGIYDSRIRRQIWKEWPWLEVCYANETSIQFSFESTSSHPKSKEFESQCAIYLQTEWSRSRFVTPPTPEGEQLDVYGYIEDEDRRVIIVGECKLREEGNEGKLIEAREVKQLYRKICAVRRHEKKHSDSSFEIRGYIISNADGLAEDAQMRARDFGIQYLKVLLTTRWSRQGEWSIRSIEERSFSD